MELSNDQWKIIKSFYVVGLNEWKLVKYKDEENRPNYFQNIDLVIQNMNVDVNQIETPTWKYIKLSTEKNCWLRIEHSPTYNEPITNFSIVKCEFESPNYLLFPKKYADQNFRPIMISHVTSDNAGEKGALREYDNIKPYNEHYVKIPSALNAVEYWKWNKKIKAAVVLVSRSTDVLPWQGIEIKDVPEKDTYQFLLKRHETPYHSVYMPEVLDTYPQDNNVNPGTAIFCFPEGIRIKKEQVMPKWFSFIWTDEVGRRTYGNVLIFSEDMSPSMVESFVPISKPKNKLYIEKAICVLSNYPFFYNCKIFLRELYRIQVSSSTNIPIERAICSFVDSWYFENLDKVLSFTIAEEEWKFYRVPIYGSDWDTTDENIYVWFSLLNYETILTLWKGLLLEWKIFLICCSKTTLLHISSALISLWFPFKWMHVLIPILPEKLKVFIESPVPLIIGLSYWHETSSHKSKEAYLEMYNEEINDLPNDALIFNIDRNCFEKYIDKLPKWPNKLGSWLMKKLTKIKPKYDWDNPDLVNRIETMNQSDEVFSFGDSDDPSKWNNEKKAVLVNEIRDIFYDFFIHMFKNYEKYFNWKKKKPKSKTDDGIEGEDEDPVWFLKDDFLKDHSSTEQGSFWYAFTETTIFNQFQDSFKYIEPNSSTSFFLDSIKKGRGKSKYYLEKKVPSISSVIPDIKIDDLKGKTFCYKNFPPLDYKLFLKTEAPKSVYQSRFIYTRDEWCYEASKLDKKEWGKYFMYTIYEIWFTYFAFVIHFYDHKKSEVLMDYAVSWIEDWINKKQIMPSKNLFMKLIKTCGRRNLTGFVKKILNIVNSSNQTKHYNCFFHNAFMNGLYTITDNIDNTCMNASMVNNSTANANNLKSSINVYDWYDKNTIEDIQTLLDKTIFVTYELCPNCLKNQKNSNKISIEEIFGGFSKSKSDYSSVCRHCFNKIFPKIYTVNEDQITLDTDTVNFLSPLVLVKEVDNIIKNKGEKYFYQEEFYKDKYHRHIFWNIAFYFQVFDLPLCVMYIQNDDQKFLKIVNFLDDSRERRGIKKKENAKRATNQSADKINNWQMEMHSKKMSTTSYDAMSCISSKSGVSNLPQYEKSWWAGIQSRLEKTANTSIMIKNNENVSVDFKKEINKRIFSIKQVIGQVSEYFVKTMKSRLEGVLENVEFNDGLAWDSHSITAIKSNIHENEWNPSSNKEVIHFSNDNYSPQKIRMERDKIVPEFKWGDVSETENENEMIIEKEQVKEGVKEIPKHRNEEKEDVKQVEPGKDETMNDKTDKSVNTITSANSTINKTSENDNDVTSQNNNGKGKPIIMGGGLFSRPQKKTQYKITIKK